MNKILRHKLISVSVAAPLALLVVTGPAAFGQAPPPDKKGKFVTADATQLTEEKQRAADEMAVALPKLREAETAARKARQAGIEDLGNSPQDRQARQREVAQREEELQAAKVAISQATLAHTKAGKALANLDQPVAAPQAKQQQQQQPPNVSGGREPTTGPQTRSRFRNALGDLQFQLGPTYYWVERINIAVQGAKNDSKGPLPPEEFVRRNPRNAPGATVDPYDALLRNIQEEYDRGPKIAQGTPDFKDVPEVIGRPIEIPTSPPKTQPKSGGTGDPALLALIARQKEKVRQLALKANTDVISPETMRIRRELKDAQQELQRLEAQQGSR